MSLNFLTMQDVELHDKRILIREDFNVPIADGVIQSDLRIRAALPGIKSALAANCQVLLMSHLGRPDAGAWRAEFSLQPVATYLQNLLGQPVKFIRDWFEVQIDPTDKIVLFENVRFLQGETTNDPQLAKRMASLCDIFVLDAFGSAHRAHSSTVGVAEFAPQAVAGPLVVAEVQALDKIMRNPQRPLVAIIGGAKVSSKLAVLQVLINKVDILIIGGGMANTMLAAQGYNVGDSLYEPALLNVARELLVKANQEQCQILLPTDVVTQDGTSKDISAIDDHDKILDIGTKTIANYTNMILAAATVLWNGPLGVFEEPMFANGTAKIAQAVARSRAFSVAGGGDTLAAIDKFKLVEQISYISTGGGAFLEYIESANLPAIMALINKQQYAATPH